MQKKWRFHSLKILTTLLSLFSSSLMAADTDIFLAVGHGGDYAKTMFPVLAVGKDQAENWSYPALSLPSDFESMGILTQAKCHQGACVATGNYRTLTKKYQNLSFTSKNNGKTWEYTPIPLAHLAEGSASRPVLSCNDNQCVMGATYTFFPSHPIYMPTLAISKDQGSTWTYSDLCNLPDDIGNQGYFSSVDCTNEMCVAVGSYLPEGEGRHQKALLATQLTHSDKWIYHELTVPQQSVDELELSRVSCSGSHCVAVGTYRVNALDKDSKTLPILYTSSDKGSSWKASFVPLKHVTEGEFQALKCYNNHCIAIGNYNADVASYRAKPFFGYSKDNGQTWHYSEPFPERTVFFSVDCNDKLCLAAGTIGTNQPFVVAYSQDHGQTWAMQKILPDDYSPTGNVSELVYAHCTQDICMAMGDYPTATKQKVPLIVMSKDQGMTWTLAKSATTQAPSHYARTELWAGGSSSITLKNDKKSMPSTQLKERLKGDCNLNQGNQGKA